MSIKPTKGSLNEYREKGKSNQDVADLVAMIDKMQVELTKALEAIAKNEPL
jgi:hypothetical protein